MKDTDNSKKPKGSSKKSLRNPPTASKVTIPPKTLKGFLAVSESLQRYIEKNNQILEQIIKASGAFDSIIDKMNLSASMQVSKILNTQIKFSELNRGFRSPALELVNSVNLSIGRLFESTDTVSINKLLGQDVLQSNAWRKQLEALHTVTEGSRSYSLALQSHLADISKFSVLSQASVSQFPWEQIGSALGVQPAIKSSLQDAFLGFAHSYSRLFDSLEKKPSIVVSLPPIISKFPTVEFFNGVNLVDTITIKTAEDIQFEEEKQQATDEVRKETEDRLETLLMGLNVEFIVLLRGARQSLYSTNPDNIRHFAISLRELFNHVLHRLAPDDEIKAWSKNPEYYDKGKPTRKARLFYICRKLNHEPFSDFLEKDIDAVLEFLQLFQRGSHEIVPKYTNTQLRMMLLRMESMLRYLLEMCNAG